MNSKLVKEIITTTTERFSEEGTIKEKVTETREKVYNNNFSDKEVSEAELVETIKEEVKEESVQREEAPVQKETPSNEELIKQAAANLDANRKQQDQQKATPSAQPATQQPQTYTNPLTPPPGYQPIGQVPQYNVVGRQPQPQQTTFPWEQPKY